MHCHLLHMFGYLKEVGHECKMDNLFNPVNLACAAYLPPQKMKIHEVIWTNGLGAPPLVFQEELMGKQANFKQGTAKAAGLKNDSISQDLIVASCFDQTPFYMISQSIEKLTWAKWTKRIWSSALTKSIPFTFLCQNISHDYNHEMNDNVIVHQLQLVYCMMRFQLNEKWWWAIFIWGFEVSLANA